MKFEMTTNEFSAFCAHLQQGARVPLLEGELATVHSELDDARNSRDVANDDRNYIQRRLDRANAENDELLRTNGEVQRELRTLKAEVLQMQDNLIPNRIERAYSRAFNFQLTGQKIQSIKEVRALLNIGLKEAKDVVESTFHDTNHPNLYTLAHIYRHLGGDPISTEQRVRLTSLLGVVHTDEILDSILTGTFGS
jgi:chromosome segregation ATPase